MSSILEFFVLLVAQCLDRGSVDDALAIVEGHANNIQCHHGFPSKGVYKNLKLYRISEKRNKRKKIDFDFE